MSRLEDLLLMMSAELPGFIATLVVEVESGMSVAQTSVDPNFDTSAASASYAEVVKANAQALDLLGIGAGTAEDILISLRNANFLIRVLGKDYYQGLAIARQTTLGFARAVMKKYDPLLMQALREIG